MIEYENDCLGCAVDGYPCDPFCTRRRTKHFYCDRCGCEDRLYNHNGEQLCLDCIEEERGEEVLNLRELDAVEDDDE